MTRILITGGGSYLGRHLVPLVLADSSADLLYTYHSDDPLGLSQGRPLDILDSQSVQAVVQQYLPDVIIHTVGSNRGDNMDAVIREGTANITAAAADSNARLIHLSTDVIFDGRNPPYSESARPSPLNAYGHAKAYAETIVSEHDNHVIVRTSLIYGLRLMDHGTQWMAEALRQGRPVRLFDNQRRNPVWVQSLSAACLELAAHPYRGTLNVAGTETVTRAEFSRMMMSWWDVSHREAVEEGPSDGSQWSLDCELDLTLAASLLSTPLPGVHAVLDAAARRGQPLPLSAFQ